MHDPLQGRDRLRPTLTALLEADQYARDVCRDRWEFAIDHSTLHKLGASDNDLRWLVCKGCLAPAREVTADKALEHRAFEPQGPMVFDARTCFVLTATGLQQAAEWLSAPCPSVDENASPATPVATQASIPRWNAAARVLEFQGHVIKQFRLPAQNQELILTAFEEDGWPERIDDPLPPRADLDPQRRLHDAINRLNRHQRHRVIRFYGNGTGRAIVWRIVPAA